MPRHEASSYIAAQMTGDLAGITYVQRTQLKRTSYVKEWPKPAATPSQSRRRLKFTQAVILWKTLPAQDKETLNKIAAHFNMILSGFNLLISCYLNNRPEWIADWAQQINLTWPYTDDWTHI